MMKRLSTQELVLQPDALDVSDSDRFVSSRSRWRDPMWRLDFDYFGARHHGAAIPWFEDIDPAVVELFKKVVWSALAQPAGRPVTTSTFAHYSTGISILGRFMTRWEYLDFHDFDRKAVDFLEGNLRDLVQSIDASDYYDIDLDEAVDEASDISDAFENDDGDAEGGAPAWTRGRVSFSVVETIFGFIAMIFRQRRILRKMGVEIGDVDPLGGESPRQWSLRVRAPNPKNVNALPDEIAIPLMIAADRLLGSPADEVIRLQADYLAARNTTPGKDATDWQRARATRALTGRSFSTLPRETAPWHPPLPLQKPDGTVDAIPRTIRDLVVSIRDVCVLTLLQLTGMRIGEIVTLRASTSPVTGLPLCVTTRRSGERTLFYAESIVNKGRDVPEPEIWLLGSVPFGSKHVPTTVRAIQILNDLLEPWRDMATGSKGRVSLIVSLLASGLPEKASGVGAPTVFSVSRGVKQAYARLLDWEALPACSHNGEDLSRYKRTRGWCISASQWRKTFATNIVRTDSRLLNALRRHFKHLNLATTEGDYVGNRAHLLEEMDEAQLQMTMRFLRERTRGGAPTIGRTGSIIKRNLQRIRLLEDHGHPLLGEDLPEALRASETGLFHSDHGACAITVSPTKARCHEIEGGVSYLNDRPNFAFQTPEVCAGCRCFVADASHLPYWRSRFLENNAAKRALARSGELGPARVFAAKAKRAWPVLSKLRKQSSGGKKMQINAVGIGSSS